MRRPQFTVPTQLVLRALLAEYPAGELYGLQIIEATGLASGTVRPILTRLENFGWAQSRWETIDPAVEGRPRRRYYRLTDSGAESVRKRLRPPRPR